MLGPKTEHTHFSSGTTKAHLLYKYHYKVNYVLIQMPSHSKFLKAPIGT